MLLLLGFLYYLLEITSNIDATVEIENQYIAQVKKPKLAAKDLFVKDGALRLCILEALNQKQYVPENIGLTALEQLLNLKELHCVHRKVKSLNGISQLEGLEALYLTGNEIEYLEPLRWLSNLHTLNLNNNKITTIATLLYLESLDKLFLANNQVDDYSVISELPLSFIQLPDLRHHRCIFIGNFIENLDMKTKPSKYRASRQCKR